VLHPGTLTPGPRNRDLAAHGDTLMRDWGMAAKLRPGYRALFYGPPGTGKTISACLLGKLDRPRRLQASTSRSGRLEVHRRDREEPRPRLRPGRSSKGWILFFDEADALFGKRTETRDAHDRYANQEVAYLLQRIETFDGIAILASNLPDNLDDAFARRFESIIYFPLPRHEERLRLWRQGFSPKARIDEGVDLDKIAAQYELCGGAIMNVVRYASLLATVIQWKEQRCVCSAGIWNRLRRLRWQNCGWSCSWDGTGRSADECKQP
jgi:SpoVK/Ycf46/Vps4 family AAA+-type ATPase